MFEMALAPGHSIVNADAGRFRRCTVDINRQMANADHAGGAIIAILRKKLERIERFLCACVNSCRALLPLRRVTAAARGRRAREDLHSLRS